MKLEYRKILYELEKNSRQTSSVIARRLELSEEQVDKVIGRLINNKIIINCFPMVEFRDLGYFFGVLLIKLRKNKKEKFFHEALKLQNNTIILEAEGIYDAYVAVSIKGMNNLNNFNQLFNKKFSEYIYYYDCAVANGFHRFYRSYLIGKNEINPRKEITGRDKKIYPIDPIDLKIISLLNRDCRVYSDEKIARQMDMPIEQVGQRIKYLEKEGTIQCYTVLLDHNKLGIERYRVLFKVTGFTQDLEKKFINYCNSHKNIVHFLRLFGSWDFLVEIEFFKKETSISLILKNIEQKFGKNILKSAPLRITKVDRYKDIILKLN